MSSAAATMDTTEFPAQERASSYKSFLKPGKFWQKSNKVATTTTAVTNNEEKKKHTKYTIAMPPALTLAGHKVERTTALRETAKGQVYKLSTINDSGVYLPPSPTLDSKRDHWIELDEEALAFKLPGPECLTTRTEENGKKHCSFFTPSAIVSRKSSSYQSYISMPRPISLDSPSDEDTPSLMTDSTTSVTSVNNA